MTRPPAINATAARGFASGAAEYARGRPEYPNAIVGWLTDALGLATGRRVLDLASGTGKFLPRLVATGAEVVAVEPVAEMRAEAMARHPGLEFRAGTAEAIPLADASLDAVTVAQAFHWFATTAARAEIARVLRPGGVLGLIWNERDDRVGWVRGLGDFMAPYQGDTPRFAGSQWRDLFPGGGFGTPQETVFEHGHTGPAESVIIDRVMSVSYMASLPEAERTRLRAALRAFIDATPELAGRGEVTFPYTTHAFAIHRDAA